MTIARLSAIAGVDRVGSPVTVNSHQPGAFAMERFSPPTPTAALANGAPDSVLALRTFRPPIPIDVVCDRGHPDFIRYKKGTDLFSPPLPPRPRAQSPLRGENKSVPFLSVLSPFSGRVVTLGGPWRLNGEWWRAEPLARDYYDAEISNGCVYRIYREHVSGRWYADGVYD
jgi:hypothetical protein